MAVSPTLPSLTKVCDFATIKAFAVLSDDFNPIHIDHAFARASPMGGIIAHGPMLLGLVWQMLHMAVGSEAAARLSLDVRFLKPAREDDVVRVEGVASAGEADAYDVTVHNQNDELLITGTARLRAAG
jgi:3-hydroxybutyryl-CoA dehydratase